jgi:broad-specificity NMP kinase
MSACPHCNFGLGQSDMKPNRGLIVCPECGETYSIPWLPFFVITGGGGCGKTTVAQSLIGHLDSCVIIETDDYGLIRGGFDTNDDFFHYLIFLSMKLSRNGRPVVLCGWVGPSQILASSRLKFFSAVHILVLTCEADVQTDRLKTRNLTPPAAEKIEMALRATQIMKKEIELYDNVVALDTTELTQEQTVAEVERWILERL